MNYAHVRNFIEVTAGHKQFSFFVTAILGTLLMFFSITKGNNAFAYHGLAVFLYSVMTGTLRTIFQNLDHSFSVKWFLIVYAVLEVVLALLLSIYLLVSIVDNL